MLLLAACARPGPAPDPQPRRQLVQRLQSAAFTFSNPG